MPLARRVSILVLTCFAACGGKTTAGLTDAAISDTTPAASCSWSSSFDAIDATPMRDSCRAARALLSCTASDADRVTCITDRAECDLPSRPGLSYSCKNLCKANQFAATCGDLTGSSVVPPADCERRSEAPGGIYYCCACSM
jgi:hypothetical protein